MRHPFVNPREGSEALQRISHLLNASGHSASFAPTVEPLRVIVDALRRAAASGYFVHHSALDQMLDLLRPLERSLLPGRLSRSERELLVAAHQLVRRLDS